MYSSFLVTHSVILIMCFLLLMMCFCTREHTLASLQDTKNLKNPPPIFLCLMQLEFLSLSFPVLFFESLTGCLKYPSYLQPHNPMSYNSYIVEFLVFVKNRCVCLFVFMSVHMHTHIHTQSRNTLNRTVRVIFLFIFSSVEVDLPTNNTIKNNFKSNKHYLKSNRKVWDVLGNRLGIVIQAFYQD